MTENEAVAPKSHLTAFVEGGGGLQTIATESPGSEKTKLREAILDNLKLAEPFFNRLHAEERAATGGTEWITLAKREFLFQCTSVAITRGNTMVLGTLCQSRQQQPSANTKRGKPHHATLEAGLWDEPPQLARALATGFHSV